MGKRRSNSKIKKRNEKLIVCILFIIILLVGCGGEEEKPTVDITKLGGEYLGEPFPFKEAEVFVDGLVDDKHSIQNVIFSQDGKEFYFTRTTLDSDSSTIFVSYLVNDVWTSPKPVSFSNEFNESDPFITYDNSKLFFTSDRPITTLEESYFDYNIWYVERRDSGWSEAVYLKEINSSEDEYSPSVAENGTLYFSSARANSEGYWDVYQSELVDGKYTEPRKSLYPVNTKYRDWDPFISKDEQKILFVSDRPGGNGGGDVYFSMKDNDGRWTDPVNLGTKINTNEYEYFPRLSYDGNFLFFTRLLTNEENFYQDKGPDTRDPFTYIYLPEGGRGLVYWMAVDSLSMIKF